MTLMLSVAPSFPDKSKSILKGASRPDLIRDEVLSEIFAATVTQHGQRLAMICDEDRLTYAEVNEISDHIAQGLINHGVKVGDVVGLWMPRGDDLLISQIAITKVGAAWLPFDAEAPLERIGVCLKDAGATYLITHDDGGEKARAAGLNPLLSSDLARTELHASLPARAAGLTRDHIAYLIYTSGSTGTPKGIAITHSNICHFLRAANAVYGLTETDIMFQGTSAAFDLSMEEIWVPYLVGAQLFVATPKIIGETDKLVEVMNSQNITVIDTVPTLLAMLSGEVPSLKTIILGGEACPPSVVSAWEKPGRTIYNSYGPTEATVVATLDEVKAGEPVTIGGPIANYSCYVVDEGMQIVAPNLQGELLIGGPGVAQGYLQRADLTAEKFIANPFASDGTDPILYRSGDAVSINDDGKILFAGRIDDQVKIRGFRVELGEIEAKVQALPDVANAAVVLRKDNDIDQLVAFIIARTIVKPDAKAMRKALREQLPPYMVPSRFEVVNALPKLTSGKVDRKALRAVELQPIDSEDEQDAPQTDTEALLLAAAKKVFAGQAVPFEADFFNDLGGHSLLAARFIGFVRETPRLAGITLQDVYGLRTLRAIGQRLDDMGASMVQDLSFAPPPFMRRFWCGLAQAAAMPFIFGLVTIQWLGLFLSSIWLLNAEDITWYQEMATLMAVYVGINIGVKFVIIALKWLIIGRTKPGVYPLWGVYYFRLWLVQRLVQTTTLKFLQCSPLIRWYMRALGAKIGKDAMIGEFEAGAIDLIEIGDNASTGMKVKMSNVEIVADKVYVGPIKIGHDGYVGNSSVLCYGAEIGDHAEIADLTVVAPNQKIAAAEKWDGSPSHKVGMVDIKALPDFAEASSLRRFFNNITYVVSYIVMQMIGLLPIFPAFYVLYNLDSLYDGVIDTSVSWLHLPLLTWPTAMILIVVTMIVIIALRWIILPRVSEGTYSIHSPFYLRKWTIGLATEVTLETLSSLYATVYMQHWYRMMGAKIGKGSEMSTNLAGRYDLVEVGDNNFIGDETIFGDEELRRGWMQLNRVKTGDRVFFGNDSVIAAGAVIENDALIGVKSKLPNSMHVKSGETWFGSPAMAIPNRQKVKVEAQWTYDPPKAFKIFRYVFEALHTALPTAIFITCGYITADVIQVPIENGQWLRALFYFFASGIIISAVLIVAVAIFKWLLMGRYKPTMQPMWSVWAMRTEAVAVLYGGLVGKASIEFLRGTPFLPWVLNLYGAHIGKGVCMVATDITEFDCVTVGDYSVINDLAVLQTHLYEDRIMKVGRIEVGKGVTVGAGATVLYDTKVGDYAQLGPLTVVMKGESIPASTSWVGAPAQPGVLPH